MDLVFCGEDMNYVDKQDSIIKASFLFNVDNKICIFWTSFNCLHGIGYNREFFHHVQTHKRFRVNICGCNGRFSLLHAVCHGDVEDDCGKRNWLE